MQPRLKSFLENGIPFLCLYLAFSILLGSRLFFLHTTPELTLNTFGSPEENLHVLVGAKNLVKYGWQATFGLPDYVTSNNPADHAVVYTHFPPLPTFIAAILLKLDLSLKEMRLIHILMSTAGWLTATFVLRSLLNQPQKKYSSLLLLIFSLSIPNIMWADHFEYSLTPLMIFLPFLINSLLSKKRHRIILIWITLLFSALLNYKIASVATISFGFYFFLTENIPTKKKFFIVLFFVSAAVVGVGIHLLQNIVYLGPSVAIQELYLTLRNRVTGNPPNCELADWFRSNNLVLWGSNEKLKANSFFHSIFLIFQENIQAIKKFFPIYLWPIVFICFLRKRIFIKYKKFLYFIISLSAGVFVWNLVFPAHSIGYFLAITELLPAYFFSFLFWLIILNNAKTIQKIARKGFKKQARLIYILILIVLLGHFVYRSGKFIEELNNIIINENKYNFFENAKTLSKLSDSVIWTNMTSVWVGYFTDTVVPGRTTLDALKNQDLNKCFNLFINSRQPLHFYKKPKYFIFSETHLSGNTEGHDSESIKKMEFYLKENLSLVEKFKNFSVYEFRN